MPVIFKNNSGGWETSPFMRRLRGFGAYLPFWVPIAAAPFALWNELLVGNVEPVAPLLQSLETTLNSLPEEQRIVALAGAGALSFALAKAPARECFAALAWVTRPVRRILAWRGDGKGGHAGFGSLFGEFDTRYRKGMIFLGSSLYDPGLYLGEHGESGLLTFGAARSGKQRGGTIPVCGTWPYSLFCIDAKAQHSNVSYWRRLRFGPAFVSAPFGRLQDGIEISRWNPLEWLDPQSDTYFEDVLALADACVVPTDMRNFFFDDSARQIIAGAISHVRTTAPTTPNLLMVRKLGIFALPPEKVYFSNPLILWQKVSRHNLLMFQKF